MREPTASGVPGRDTNSRAGCPQFRMPLALAARSHAGWLEAVGKRASQGDPGRPLERRTSADRRGNPTARREG